MISIEEAKKSISGLGVTEIRELTTKRLLGKDVATFGSGHSSEPCEDLVIQLLRDPNPAEDIRKAIVASCEDVYAKVLEWLARPNYQNEIPYWQDIVIRICRVVDSAAPVELAGHANSIMALVLAKGYEVPQVLGAAVRACMGYKDKSMLTMWEQIIDKYPNVAAYAFNALLKIDPTSEKIEEYLKILWRRQTVDSWPVDTAFLMRRAARVRNETALIYRVLLKLKNSDLSLWKKVEKELKEPWSQQWLEGLKGLEQSLSPKASRKVFKEQIIPPIKKRRQGYFILPEVEFKHGIGADQLYYGFVKIRSGLFHTDWVSSIDRLVQKQVSKKKIKSVDFEKESEEIEHGSKVG